MVTRGPGATNAAIGVHTAMQDSAPMILFVGQVGTDMRGREAFQELDYRAVFGTMAKWVVEIDRVERIPELSVPRLDRGPVRSPRPGCHGPARGYADQPVRCGPADRARCRSLNPRPKQARLPRRWRCWPGPKRPLLMLGGCNWTPAGRSGTAGLCRSLRPADAGGLPVSGSVRQSLARLRGRGGGGHAAPCQAPDPRGGCDPGAEPALW